MIPGVPPFAWTTWRAELEQAEQLRAVERRLVEAERRIGEALLEAALAPLPATRPRIVGLLGAMP